MAPPPAFEISYSVFLPGKMALSQAGVDYQLAHAGDFSCEGLNTLTITLMVVVTIAVALRLWSRKIAKIDWKSDDYTLVLGWVLSMGAGACSLNITYNGGFCRHTYIVLMDKPRFEQFGKTAYALNIFYTTGYPVSRISLVLLYRRVFIQQWVKKVCWFLIFCYTGYAIGSMIADFCQMIPVQSVWNPDVRATQQIDGKALFLANCGFNIATDFILLVLPLIVIWSMKSTRFHKLGLSAIFGLGVLTVIASVARLIYYYKFDVNDPMWGVPASQFWTIVETMLGLLCPCLVTLGPLIRSGYIVFSSKLSSSARTRLERITGISTAYVIETQLAKSEFGAAESSTTRVNENGFQQSLRSVPSQLEAGAYNDMAPGVPSTAAAANGRDKHGMAVDQDIALANLDPRTRTREAGQGAKRMGMSSIAVADEQRSGNVPDQGIGVLRDWRLDSE